MPDSGTQVIEGWNDVSDGGSAFIEGWGGGRSGNWINSNEGWGGNFKEAWGGLK